MICIALHLTAKDDGIHYAKNRKAFLMNELWTQIFKEPGYCSCKYIKTLNRTGASGEKGESGINNPSEDESRKSSSSILGQLETGGSRRVNSRASH